MKTYRIKISSWTASFRYPNLISGYQPTLDVPPISTVLGLLNAATGRYSEQTHLIIGYYFEYEAKSTDLETIYQIELKVARNIKQRDSLQSMLSFIEKNDSLPKYIG